MENCIICNKINRNKDYLYQDEYWVITAGDYNSQVPGYMYLEPRRHVENWSEFTLNELSLLGQNISRAEKVLYKLVGIERLYAVVISEAVRHLHYHLIPRTEDNETRGIKLIEQATSGRGESRFNQDEFAKLMLKIKTEFQEQKE